MELVIPLQNIGPMTERLIRGHPGMCTLKAEQGFFKWFVPH